MNSYDDSASNTRALVQEVILLTKELAKNAIERSDLEDQLAQAQNKNDEQGTPFN